MMNHDKKVKQMIYRGTEPQSKMTLPFAIKVAYLNKHKKCQLKSKFHITYKIANCTLILIM